MSTIVEYMTAENLATLSTEKLESQRAALYNMGARTRFGSVMHDMLVAINEELNTRY